MIRIAAVLLLLAAPAIAAAQQRYQPPYGRTISPYLDYLNPNPGPTNAFYSYILPQRALQQTMRQIDDAFFRQQSGLRTVNERVAAGLNPPPTGSAGTYQEFSHFYPTFSQRPPQAQPQRQPNRRRSLNSRRLSASRR